MVLFVSTIKPKASQGGKLNGVNRPMQLSASISGSRKLLLLPLLAVFAPFCQHRRSLSLEM